LTPPITLTFSFVRDKAPFVSPSVLTLPWNILRLFVFLGHLAFLRTSCVHANTLRCCTTRPTSPSPAQDGPSLLLFREFTLPPARTCSLSEVL
jgi:hypothetical protein